MIVRLVITIVVAALTAIALAAPAAHANRLSASDKAEVVAVTSGLLDRFVEQVYVAAWVRLRQAEWSSSGRPYTADMAERDRRIARLQAGGVLIWHRAVDQGVAVATRAGTALDAGDPRVSMRAEFETALAFVGGVLSAVRKRWPPADRHAAWAAELERRLGGHETFRNAASERPQTPGRECGVDVDGRSEDVRLDDAADYRRYKAAHANRDWARRPVRTELLPLVAVAPCVAYYELVERGDAREALRTLGNAIEVSHLLRVPPELTIAQAQAMGGVIVPTLLQLLAFLGWSAAGMP